MCCRTIPGAYLHGGDPPLRRRSPEFAFEEHNVLAAEYRALCFPCSQPRRCHFNVLDAPGLGVEFIGLATINYLLFLCENPQWVRRDGGYKNFSSEISGPDHCGRCAHVLLDVIWYRVGRWVDT